VKGTSELSMTRGEKKKTTRRCVKYEPIAAELHCFYFTAETELANASILVIIPNHHLDEWAHK
jgi:hypothetical protein